MSRRKLVSWKALPRSRAGAERVGRERLEDRQHHLADDRGRPVHVAEQIVVGLVRVDRQVHRHRTQEAAEAVGVDVEAADGVHDRLQHGVIAPTFVEVSEEAVAERGELLLSRTSVGTSPRSSTMSSA